MMMMMVFNVSSRKKSTSGGGKENGSHKWDGVLSTHVYECMYESE